MGQGRQLYHQRRFDDAIQELGSQLEIEPDVIGLHTVLTNAYYFKGMPTEAITEAEKSLLRFGSNAKATRQTPSAASNRNSFIFAWREPLSVYSIRTSIPKFDALPDDVQNELRAHALLLEPFGPQLGRPRVDCALEPVSPSR